MTAREFRIRHGTKSMPIVPSDYMRCKAFKREEKFRDISSCLPTIIFPITWPPQRAQCSEPCPGVSSSRKENLFIEGREKRVHSSTICFLSCNIHPLLGLGLRWYTSSQIFRLCGHSAFFLWYTFAYTVESNLCACIYFCQSVASVALINLQNSVEKAKSSLAVNYTFAPKIACNIPCLLLPNPCLLCYIISYYLGMIKMCLEIRL